MMAKKPAARITKSLAKFRSQANALAPGRSKASDGWLGDSKHSMRKSDHNPEPDGTVDAFDLTHDPKNGVDIQKICDAIIASKDQRVSYLICNGKIISGKAGPQPWVKRPYTGPNKHTKHLHVSVLDNHQDDETPWKIEAAFGRSPNVAAAPKPANKPVAKPVKNIYDGGRYEEVRAVQERLDALDYPEVGTIDGRWGGRTRATILSFRADNGLPLVPVIDEKLMAALMTASPRYIAPKRANATLSDLREEGAKDVAAADNTQIAAYATAGLGAAGGVGKIVEQFKEYGGFVQTIADTIAPIQTFIAQNFWLLAIGVGVVVIWQTGILKRIRLEKHQTGNDVSV